MVSILYYAMVLRNANRTRSAQLFMSLHSEMSSMEGMARFLDTMYMEWDDYADFERKYGSDNNSEAYAQRLTLWNTFNNFGVLLKRGLIDPEMIYDAAGGPIVMSWEKWRPIIIEQRVRYFGSNYLENWEHLVDIMRSVQMRRGITWEPPKTGFEFVEYPILESPWLQSGEEVVEMQILSTVPAGPSPAASRRGTC
jgi:hypothetical protein